MLKAKDDEPLQQRVRTQAFKISSAATASDLKIKNMKILEEIYTEARLATATNCRLQLYVDDKEDVYTQH